MCHHTEKPAVEQLPPILIVTWHQVGKRADAVFPVPMPGTVQIFLHRIVQRHAVGSEVTVHVPVPYPQPFQQGVHCHAVARPLVHYVEIEMDRITLAIFQVTHQLVVPEFVAPFHELVQLQGGQLFGSQQLPLSEALAFLIQIVQRDAHRLLVRLAVIVYHHLPHHFFFGNTGFETLFTDADKQRVKVVPVALPVLRLVQRPVQGGFKQ